MKRIDITGQMFGEITVIKLSDKKSEKGTRLWQCRCSCDRIIYLLGVSLRYGHYKSCGCKRMEKRDQGARNYEKTDRVDGTRKSALKSKLHSGNTSGHKGVGWSKTRKKWTAQIGFQRKQINLGYFKEKEAAINARKLAEEKYHKPYLDQD